MVIGIRKDQTDANLLKAIQAVKGSSETSTALDFYCGVPTVQRKQGLLTTGPTSSGIYVENGRVYARFLLRNLFMRVSGRAASVVVPGPEIVAGKWQTVRVVCDQQTAWVEVDGVKKREGDISGP